MLIPFIISVLINKIQYDYQRQPFYIFVFLGLKGAYIYELQATLKDRQCYNEQTEKTPRQPTLRKIKRGVLPTHLPTQKHHI